MGNGGWVTPQLDNILEKAILLGYLWGKGKSAKPFNDIPSNIFTVANPRVTCK